MDLSELNSDNCQNYFLVIVVITCLSVTYRFTLNDSTISNCNIVFSSRFVYFFNHYIGNITRIWMICIRIDHLGVPN